MVNLQVIDGQYEVYSTVVGSGVFTMHYDGFSKDAALAAYDAQVAAGDQGCPAMLAEALYGGTPLMSDWS